MKITGFYSRNRECQNTIVNQIKVKINKASKLIGFCATAFVAINAPTATPAMASPEIDAIGKIASTTFGPGGPGALIISLLLIALVGWISGYIAQAAGKKQVAGMIHVVTLFSCIAMVADAAYNALGALGRFLG